MNMFVTILHSQVNAVLISWTLLHGFMSSLLEFSARPTEKSLCFYDFFLTSGNDRCLKNTTLERF